MEDQKEFSYEDKIDDILSLNSQKLRIRVTIFIVVKPFLVRSGQTVQVVSSWPIYEFFRGCFGSGRRRMEYHGNNHQNDPNEGYYNSYYW
mmetsp:Transcript_64051/g.73516  ORF Transcript_64051/g.73516 Transcript_64051/m.73516 type:complete len:90 (-) Transcript_64051:2986-3255(-)